MSFKTRAVAVAAGLGLALACAPGVALADELATVSEEPAAVTALSEGVSPADGADDAGVAADEDATGTPGSAGADVTGADAGAADATAEGADGAIEGGADAGAGDATADEAPADEDAAADEGTGAEAAPDDGGSDPTDLLASSSLPAVGWTGDSYWDGTTNADGTARLYTGWVIDDHDGQGLQRYWVVDGQKFRGGLFDAGADGWGYALSDLGWVLRGRHDVGDLIYLANNDGRLLDCGWTVTGEFTGGELQRYYIEDDHAIHRGYADTGGYGHYVTDEGYVARGKSVDDDGTVALADNDGRTASAGWHVTGDYDGGVMQRYYVDPLTHVAALGLFTVDGARYCGVSGLGYVLRGKLAWGGTHVLLANNDGLLETAPGWLVTGAYDGGALQRYWIAEIEGEEGYFGALVDFFDVAGSSYFGDHREGYVRRNAHAWRLDEDDYTAEWLLADNDGVLSPDESDYSRLVNSYVSRIVAYALDDTHGYDQTFRWGEKGDYDCSSLVITCLREAGLATGGATYTGNMRDSLTGLDFVWIENPTELQRGDILLNETYHTGIYLGGGLLANASGNENGEATGGEPGDQTGREIWVRPYYDYPWDGVLRPKNYVA